MKFCIIMGSPRPAGNTAELLNPFMAQLDSGGAEIEYIPLPGKDIRPCLGCCACQQVEGEFGCVQEDDVGDIMDSIIASDFIVLATPIYTWYCTAQMKALLDRHYGLNKFYGTAKGSLWKGKKVAIIATHGYKAEYAAEPFETGIKRLCKHSGLDYVGMYSARDKGDFADFKTEEAVAGARAFATQLLSIGGQ